MALQKRKTMTPLALDAFDLARDDAINLAISQIAIENNTTEVREDLIIKTLINEGQIYRIPDGSRLAGWYRGTPGSSGRDRNGNPTTYKLTTFASDGRTFIVDAGSVCRIRANAVGVPPRQHIESIAQQIALCDRAILVNLIGSMLTRLYPIERADDADELQVALSAAMAGLPATVKREVFDAFSAADVSIPFIGDRLEALRTQLQSRMVKRFGGVAPAQYKAERVQTAEVNANVGEGIDSIYMIITQANRDAEHGGIAERFRYIGFGAQYDPDIEEDEVNE